MFLEDHWSHKAWKNRRLPSRKRGMVTDLVGLEAGDYVRLEAGNDVWLQARDDEGGDWIESHKCESKRRGERGHDSEYGNLSSVHDLTNFIALILNRFRIVDIK